MAAAVAVVQIALAAARLEELVVAGPGKLVVVALERQERQTLAAAVALLAVVHLPMLLGLTAAQA